MMYLTSTQTTTSQAVVWKPLPFQAHVFVLYTDVILLLLSTYILKSRKSDKTWMWLTPLVCTLIAVTVMIILAVIFIQNLPVQNILLFVSVATMNTLVSLVGILSWFAVDQKIQSKLDMIVMDILILISLILMLVFVAIAPITFFADAMDNPNKIWGILSIIVISLVLISHITFAVLKYISLRNLENPNEEQGDSTFNGAESAIDMENSVDSIH